MNEVTLGFVVGRISDLVCKEAMECIKYEDRVTRKEVQDKIILELAKYYGFELKSVNCVLNTVSTERRNQ